MKYRILGIGIALSLVSCVSKKHHNELLEKYNTKEKEVAALQEKLKTDMNLENEIDKVSYSLGVNMAENLRGQGLNSVNYDALAQGVKDVYSKQGVKIDALEAQRILQNYFQKIAESQSVENKEAGEKFLAENAKRKGVAVLPSGLQYEILKEGNGPKPTASSVVKTHYHGTLINGEVFDSSVDRGQPTSFPVNRVIAGWTEALQLMPVGSKWKLFIPYNLAYGERGAGGKIGPYSALVFEVELIEIEE